MTQRRLGEASGNRRATVCWIMVCFSIERQQLLGAPLAAQRPEAGAAPAGENHGMKVRLSHGLRI